MLYKPFGVQQQKTLHTGDTELKLSTDAKLDGVTLLIADPPPMKLHQ